MYTEVTWMRGNIATEIVTEIPTSESAHQLSFIGAINDMRFTYICIHSFLSDWFFIGAQQDYTM